MNDAPSPNAVLTLLQRAMAESGVRTSAGALLEACEGDVSMAALARCAREAELEADVVRLRGNDVTHVTAGSLVALEDGSAGLVIAHDPAGAVLEDAARHRRHVGRRGEPRPAMALTLRAKGAAGVRFLPRVVARVAREPHVKRAVVLSALLACALIGLGLAGPLVTRAALGAALPDRARSALRLLAIGTVLLGVQLAYLGLLRQRALLYVSAKLEALASREVVAHLLALPFRELRKLDVGGAQQAVSSGAVAAEAISALAPQLVDALLGLGYLVLAFVLDPQSAVVAGVAGLIVVFAGIVHGLRRVARRRVLLARTREEQQLLFEVFGAIETVKSEGASARMLGRWLERLVAEEKAALDLRLQTSVFSAILAAADRLVFAMVLLLVARRCLQADASVADLVAAVQATASFLACAQKLALLPMALGDARGHLERTEQALAAPPERVRGPQAAPETDAPALAVRDLWFRYADDAPWVLAGLDLVVRPGETAMLAWPSGMGKSTLLRLLSGLLAPTRGDVLVHGTEARQARRLVTYVPQHATLLPVSILENLRILSGHASTRRLLEAAHATGLLEVVAAWGMGLDTVLSLGASNVSSGQKQLVLFTAALASSAPVVLLDEALAHVDLGLRSRLEVQAMFHGRTVISVVHDASARERSLARVVAEPGSRD